MSLYSRLDRLAADVEKLNKQVTAVSNQPQSQRTSVEGGSIDFNDNDGNLKAIVGGQEDGGTTINVIAGPTPPTPVNYTVTVDHGSLTVHWDGEFENDAVAPTDWARWTAYAQPGEFVVPERSTAIGGTDSASGGEVTAGVLKGQWTVTVLAWSQAGKPSAMGLPVTVDVPGYGDIVLAEIDAAETVINNAGEILVTEQDTLNDKLNDAFGQIEDAIISANGKNVVHYEDAPPTESDPGVEGDTWFVGQVGRPNDEILATNLITNPSFENDTAGWNPGNRVTLSVVSLDGTVSAGTHSAEFKFPTGGANATTSMRVYRDVYKTVSPGQWVAMAAFVRRGSNAQSGLEAQLYAEFATSSGSYISRPMSGAKKLTTDRMDASPTSPNRQTFVVQVPAGAGLLSSPGIRFQADGDMAKVASSDYGYMDAWQIRVAGSQAEAVAAIEAYFDGDTPDGATDNDPHYRWIGDPHASSSEKYLPATEGLSSNWNVTEQYRYVNGAWENVELSHTVLSSLDLGKLVAGSAAIKEAVVQKLFAEVVVSRMSVADEFIGENAILTGAVTAPKITASEELWAKIGEFVKIRAEQLEADAIDGMVITGPNIRTAASGARVQLDAGGVRIFNDNDEVRTQLSPDGSTFKGEVEADSLVVNGGSEFRSTENRLGQGAKLTLEAGVTDPTAPPVVQPFWKALEFDASGLGTLYGLAWAGGKYWTMAGRTSTIGDESVISIDGATGAVGDEIPMTGGFSPVGGVTAIGSELFMLGPKANAAYKYFVRVYSTSGTFLREWEYAEAGWGPGNPLGYKPGIGNNGTDVVIAHCTDAGSLNVRTYNKTSGALLITLNMNDNTASDIAGVHVGAADWGGGTFVTINKASTGKFYSFTTAGVVDLTKTFDAANGVQDTGVVFHDGKFYSLSSNGRISQYEASNMGDNSNNWWATYRWSVDADDDGVNDSVSRIGPAKQFSWPRRSRLRFLGAPLPDGTGYITPSIAYKTTKPVRTDFRTPPFSVYGGESTAWYSELPSNWQSGAYPGDVNDFPNATPSTLVSASNTFQVNGDGSGRWGPLTFNADGTMSSSAVPAWVPVTTFKSGFSAYTFGFAPAYRVWPDGKVEWRGVVGGSIAASGITPIITIPTAARPTLSVNVTAATSGGAGTAVTRVEFSGTSSVTDLTVTANGTARVWVSLDGIFYYKS